MQLKINLLHSFVNFKHLVKSWSQCLSHYAHKNQHRLFLIICANVLFLLPFFLWWTGVVCALAYFVPPERPSFLFAPLTVALLMLFGFVLLPDFTISLLLGEEPLVWFLWWKMSIFVYLHMLAWITSFFHYSFIFLSLSMIFLLSETTIYLMLI